MKSIFAATLALLVTIITLAARCQADEPVRLMPLVVQWQYPGSEIQGASMSDAATVNRSGERTVPSIICKTIFTTKDPIAKVTEYYTAKLKQPDGSTDSKEASESAEKSGRSVMVHDDSEGRPLQVHIIVVNTDKTSTTLVISRAETEPETHIAWTHYMRF